MPSQLRALLDVDLRFALRARDATRVAVLRTTLAALANAEAVDPAGVDPAAVDPTATAPIGTVVTEVARRTLSVDDELRIVESERAELDAAADEMARLAQLDRAEQLRAQVRILDDLLSRAGAG